MTYTTYTHNTLSYFLKSEILRRQLINIDISLFIIKRGRAFLETSLFSNN